MKGMTVDAKTLQLRQALPLELKEGYTAKRIRNWYEHWRGEVYVSFSGGKDSTVLLDQVRKLYPHVPAVFVDTGLEYPEIRDFVKTVTNVTWLRPEMNFKDVLAKYGYPVISKAQARYIQDLQNPTENNEATRNLRLTGLNRKGVKCPSQKIAKKWLYLVHAGFKISGQCCDVMKKRPLHKYTKATGRYPLTGVMASESRMRTLNHLKTGCNAFRQKTPISTPMAFWYDADVWLYLRKYNLPYSSIYDMGEKRTGCAFCMFGVHLEPSPNRFQRMRVSHPAMYEYCMDKLGLREILLCIGVPYE